MPDRALRSLVILPSAPTWKGMSKLRSRFDPQPPDRVPVVGLVPLRSPGVGKSRLGAELSSQERAALSLAMLVDVTAALRSVPLDRIVVATSGPRTAASVTALGLEAILDPPGGAGLDAAVDTVGRLFGPEVSLLVVAADLPRLRSGDVTAVIEREESVVVGPTSDGGTAALLRRPPLAIPSSYGAGSAARHLRLASARGLETAVIHRAALRHDVDTWADLTALAHGHVGAATADFLERIRPRLEAGA